MKYGTLVLAELAASGSLAAHWGQTSINEVRVVLSDQGETGAQTAFPDGCELRRNPRKADPPRRSSFNSEKTSRTQASAARSSMMPTN